MKKYSIMLHVTSILMLVFGPLLIVLMLLFSLFSGLFALLILGVMLAFMIEFPLNIMMLSSLILGVSGLTERFKFSLVAGICILAVHVLYLQSGHIALLLVSYWDGGTIALIYFFVLLTHVFYTIAAYQLNKAAKKEIS